MKWLLLNQQVSLKLLIKVIIMLTKFIYSMILFGLFISSTTVWAGDATKLHFIGFSEEGKYLAFQQYGTADGSGIPFSTLYFVDVKHNKYPKKQVETLDTTSEKSEGNILQQNFDAGADTLKNLGIIAGNQGQKVVSHLFSDIGVELKTVRFAVGTPLAGLYYRAYALTLEEMKSDKKCQLSKPKKNRTYILNLRERDGRKDCFGVGQSRMFTLYLHNENENVAKILQKDRTLPSSRGCPLGYRIQDVYVYQEKYIAIFINMFTPGFEGQDMRYLVVTGMLN